MIQGLVRAAFVCVLGFAWAESVAALPVVSIDAQPGTPGVQASTSTALGTLVINVHIAGVEASAPLNAFEFDLDFAPGVLTAVSVADGGFLLSPLFVVQNSIGSMTVQFAEVTLGSGGAVGDGVLAQITFTAIDVGTSSLDLNDVILSAPFGVPISASIEDGLVQVVPEPSMALLAGCALAWLVQVSRRGAPSLPSLIARDA